MTMLVNDIPLGDNDAGAATIGDFLTTLLAELWVKEEGFSGKRPFGNSGWKYPVYAALVKDGRVTGTLDDDGFVETLDTDAADAIILRAIKDLTP